jgi:hypothetical protein
MDLGASGGGVTMLCNKGKLCSALPECCCLWDSVLIAQRKILFSFTTPGVVTITKIKQVECLMKELLLEKMDQNDTQRI